MSAFRAIMVFMSAEVDKTRVSESVSHEMGGKEAARRPQRGKCVVGWENNTIDRENGQL